MIPHTAKEIDMFGKMFEVMVHTFVGDTSIVKKMQDMQQRRVDYWQLKNLSDKQLKDMGISRGEIYHKVYGG